MVGIKQDHTVLEWYNPKNPTALSYKRIPLQETQIQDFDPDPMV